MNYPSISTTTGSTYWTFITVEPSLKDERPRCDEKADEIHKDAVET
jgi:hypothetical protein